MKLTVRRGIATAAVVLFAPALSACGVNFGAQTDQNYNPAVGVDNRKESAIYVLDALVVSGTDGSGTVVAALVNENQTAPDKLTSVAGSGPDASATVTLTGPTTIPAGGALNLATDAGVSISDAKVKPGSFVSITFGFANASDVSVDVPVVANTGDYANVKVPSGS